MINMDSAFATVYDIELMGHCDGFSSNRPTNITYAFTYSVIDEITGDAVSFSESMTHCLWNIYSFQNNI